MQNIYYESSNYVAPVLVEFVRWLLKEADRRRIKVLYFLARDGFVLKKIAEKICREQSIKIECRYLYCSRLALRIPSYHLIGDEAYDMIFIGGYHVMIKSFFERAGIPEDKYEIILREAGFSQNVDIARELSKPEIRIVREKLLLSETFKRSIIDISVQNYNLAIGYFNQEKLLNQEIIAIVDSGWTGSMQRSLRQLLERAGYQGKLVGFYFGLFEEPKDTKDGEYLSWYFSKRTAKNNKILFCNNLFECILSAPHGMTLRYSKVGEIYKPVLNSPPNNSILSLVNMQIEGILDGVDKIIRSSEWSTKETCAKILHRLMAHPTRTEVELYGAFMFCDDSTEKYHYSLVSFEQTNLLNRYIIISRIYRRIFKRRQNSSNTELFWVFGNIALIRNPILRAWYWINVYIWEWMKYTINNI